MGQAFEDWYRQSYSPRLSTSVLALTGDRDVAAEVTDEAFARAWRHWRRVGDMESPEGWTYRVASEPRAERRPRRPRSSAGRCDGLPRPVRPPRPPARSGSSCVELPERQRQAVVLRYVADLDEREIAEIMGVTRGTVASTSFDARAASSRRTGSTGRSGGAIISRFEEAVYHPICERTHAPPSNVPARRTPARARRYESTRRRRS